VVVVGNAFGPVGRGLKSDKSAKGKSPNVICQIIEPSNASLRCE
jgi:hypothetical protein